MDLFGERPCVADVLSPALPTSSGSTLKHYFWTGNGLLSVVCRNDSAQKFADALNLIWVAESWGGHISLVLPGVARREASPLPSGEILRFHAGGGRRRHAS
jgi:cystathionine beta-lyase